ncbi:MAG: hypothetical protein CMH30_01320 [Micavibrio sp.]|nr:hypothetical protein [Micavibrio sp.]|tara:strand:+ start:768 stop:1373 length:606 start_codon:yes stop_codon:yes gene_type:complete
MENTLTQPELGILYVEMAAPLSFQKILQLGILTDDTALALHQVIADQKPDTALITLGLCGIMLSNHLLASQPSHQDLAVLATELKYFSIDIVERYGRAWINAQEHQTSKGNERAVEEELLVESPENLNGFGSIVQEIHEICDNLDSLASSLGKLLEYQAYAHANLAENYVEMLQSEGRLPGKLVNDPIPAPIGLQNNHINF